MDKGAEKREGIMTSGEKEPQRQGDWIVRAGRPAGSLKKQLKKLEDGCNDLMKEKIGKVVNVLKMAQIVGELRSKNKKHMQ